MLNKTAKRLSAFVLLAMMILSSLPASAVTVDKDDTSVKTSDSQNNWEEKLDPYLEKLISNVSDNAKIPVWVWCADAITESEAERIGLSEVNIDDISDEEYEKELADWTNDDESDLADAEDRKTVKSSIIINRAKNRKLAAYFRELREAEGELPEGTENIFDELELNVSKDNFIYDDLQVPLYAVCLSKSDIKKAAQNDKVGAIYFYDKVKVHTEEYDAKFESPDLADKIPQSVFEYLSDYKYDDTVYARIGINVTEEEFNKQKENIFAENVEYISFDEYSKIHKDENLAGYELYSKWLSDIFDVTNNYKGEFDYQYYLEDFVNRNGLAEYKPLFAFYNSEPEIYIQLPKSEFYELLGNDEILAAGYWNINAGYDMVGLFDPLVYDSGDALDILRASVGLERWTPDKDVDQDGLIDSYDALLALRISVHLETIQHGSIPLYPLYDVYRYGVSEYIRF